VRLGYSLSKFITYRFTFSDQIYIHLGKYFQKLSAG